MTNKNKKSSNKSQSTKEESTKNQGNGNKFINWIKKYFLIIFLAIACGFAAGYLTNYLLNKKDAQIEQQITQKSATLKKISIITFLNNSIYSISIGSNDQGFPTNPLEITQLSSNSFNLSNITIPETGKLEDGMTLSEMTITLEFEVNNGTTFNAELTKQINISDVTNNQISIKNIQLQLSNLIINSGNENNFSCIFDFIL